MYLPLIDIPKHKRSAHPRCTSASVLFGLCAAMLLSLAGSDIYELHEDCVHSKTVSMELPTPEASPVKYVTVTTTLFVIDGRCRYQRTETHQMRLVELYDKLCEIEGIKDKAERSANDFYPHDVSKRKVFAESVQAYAERLFREGYGLTLKQVEEIKREGSRMKQKNEE